MIKPTVGRVVWYWPSREEIASGVAVIKDQPFAAIIAGVWSDTCVNLTIWDANGSFFSKTSVLLRQEDDERPAGGFCEWMPYQKGQAAKTEALEKMIEADK